MTNSASARILAIGVAEVTWDLIRDPSFAASVPFLLRMEREGARGVTLATQPLVPEPLWATIATGRSPGGHGIFEATCRVGETSRRPVTADDLRVPAIWHMLEAAGEPVGTFNVGLVDLAPTWLELAGVGIPDELEGTSFAGRLFPGHVP